MNNYSGRAARQRNTVHGRIINGILFPNISRAIKREIKAAAKTAYDKVQGSLESSFASIEDDTAIAVASTPQQTNSIDDIDRKGEERQRRELVGKV